ncbi:MAG: hypothetical protein ABSD75_26040 [Terriglobales bacterium]
MGQTCAYKENREIGDRHLLSQMEAEKTRSFVKRIPVYSQGMNCGDWTPEHPRGIAAFGIFLLWGATMASLAGTTLTWPGTALDHMWALNPRAYGQLARLGSKAGILLILVGIALAVSGIGWLKRRLWAWRLAVAIIVTQVVGDLVNVLLGRRIEGAIGVTVAGTLLFYLFRTQVRAVFKTSGPRKGDPD